MTFLSSMPKFIRILLLMTIIGLIVTRVFYIELQVFALNVKKYSQLNIPKNKGLQKKALQAINTIASPFFTIDTLPKDEVDVLVYDFLAQIDKPAEVNRYQRGIVEVTNERTLVHAVKKAKPGDVIFLQPGEYHIDDRGVRIRTFADGTELKPITLTASPDTVKIISGIQEAMILRNSYWQVNNIEFIGGCDLDKRCDHAIHVVGNVKNTVISHNTFKNFNAHIKANGTVKNGIRAFPENGRISSNVFYNEWVREIKASVTPIDVVGGSDWHVNDNFIADFSKIKKKGHAIGYTYGVFLKGASAKGIIENNMVVCEWKVKPYSNIDSRIGISLGGGGTSEGMCETENCEYEHTQGIIRQNKIVNCSNDVGIYLNKAQDSTVVDNFIVGSLGIDSRYNITSGNVSNNIYQGRFTNRAGSSVKYTNNTKYDGNP